MASHWWPVCPSVCASVHPSVCRTNVRSSVVSFPEDNLSNCQWIFTKPAMCFNIMEFWFRIANEQISLACDRGVLLLHVCFNSI